MSSEIDKYLKKTGKILIKPIISIDFLRGMREIRGNDDVKRRKIKEESG